MPLPPAAHLERPPVVGDGFSPRAQSSQQGLPWDLCALFFPLMTLGELYN